MDRRRVRAVGIILVGICCGYVLIKRKDVAIIIDFVFLQKPSITTFTPELLTALLALIVGALTLLVCMAQLFMAIYPFYVEKKSRRILNEKFRRGPYDRQTIEHSTRYYIRPKCSNIDPAQEGELRHALSATREDLFQKVDYFLGHDESRRHLLILADSGTGKTSFVLNYYVYNAHRAKRKQHLIAIVPLGVSDADALIASIPNKEETVLFLDALDEDTKAVDNHLLRIREIMTECRYFVRVVITCRTQFFPKDEEIPIETGIVRLGPRVAGEKGVFEFWKLYLSPFDDDDINKYIRKRYRVWHYIHRKKALALALRMPLLSVRPMLLAHIPDLITTNASFIYTSELYGAMVDAWLDRESSWVNKQDLRAFSEQLAVDIYANRELRGEERVPYQDLPTLANTWGIKLRQSHLSGRSLLNRDAQGNYKFAHRSIMEYLFVQQLIRGEENTLTSDLTDQMEIFLIEALYIRSEADLAAVARIANDPTLLSPTIQYIKAAWHLAHRHSGSRDMQRQYESDVRYLRKLSALLASKKHMDLQAIKHFVVTDILRDNIDTTDIDEIMIYPLDKSKDKVHQTPLYYVRRYKDGFFPVVPNYNDIRRIGYFMYTVEISQPGSYGDGYVPTILDILTPLKHQRYLVYSNMMIMSMLGYDKDLLGLLIINAPGEYRFDAKFQRQIQIFSQNAAPIIEMLMSDRNIPKIAGEP